MDSELSVYAGHRIAVNVKTRLEQKLKNISDVMVHVNPYQERTE